MSTGMPAMQVSAILSQCRRRNQVREFSLGRVLLTYAIWDDEKRSNLA
jgi:hypothetical protein